MTKPTDTRQERIEALRERDVEIHTWFPGRDCELCTALAIIDEQQREFEMLQAKAADLYEKWTVYGN